RSADRDARDMLAQEPLDSGTDETAGELEARLAPLGAKLAVRVVDQLAAGTTQGIKQQKELVTKAPKLTKEHGLIDWTRPAEKVCRQIRAMHPWPTAYAYLYRAGQPPLRAIVHKAQALGDPCQAAPGMIVVSANHPSALCVAAGEHTQVQIVELQPAGKRRMPAVEFLRGHRLQAGDRFGPEHL